MFTAFACWYFIGFVLMVVITYLDTIEKVTVNDIGGLFLGAFFGPVLTAVLIWMVFAKWGDRTVFTIRRKPKFDLTKNYDSHPENEFHNDD